MSIESPNKHIIDYLNGYIEKKDIDHAVMIDGLWGCGKTFFIKDYIEHHPRKNKFCHISLYGVTKTSDIDSRIFLSWHSKLTGKKTRSALKSATKIISSISLPYIQNLPSFSVKDISGFLSKKVFVFDDFERCMLSPVELLGYVNSFVEHDSIPTIILANENEMFLDQTLGSKEKTESNSEKSEEQKKYEKTREKLIGKTFSVKNDNREIVPKIIHRLDLPHEVKDILQKNIDLLFKLLDTTKKNNYRALQHCIRDFDHVCDYIDKELMKDEEFSKMMDAFFSISYEVQINNVNFNDLKQNPYTMSLCRNHGDSKEEKTPEEQRIEDFYKRHPNLFGWNNEINWEDVFNFTDINQLVSFLNEKITKREPHVYEKLWCWYDIKQADLDKLILQVEAAIEQKTFKHPAIILHIFSSFCALSKEKLYNKTLDEIKEWAEQYILSIELDAVDSCFGSFSSKTGWGGLGFQAIDTPQVKDLLKLLIDKSAERTNIDGLKYYEPLLEKLQRNDPNLSDWLNEINHNSLFAEATPERFLNVLIDAGPKVIMDNHYWIKKRISEASYIDSCKPEKPFWDELKEIIIAYLRTTKPTTTTSALKRLLIEAYHIKIDELGKVINDLTTENKD